MRHSTVSKVSQRFTLDPLAAHEDIDKPVIVRWSLIALLVLLGLLFETTIFSSWRIFGAAPTFGYVAVAAVAYYAGANTAVVFGFFAGIGADIFYQTPLGVSAIAMMACGVAVGIIQTGMMRPTPIVVPILAGAVSFAGNILYIILSGIMGFESLISFHNIYLIVVSSIINAIASPFIFIVVKKFIGAPAWRNR